MPRPRKVPIIFSKKRVRYKLGIPEIVQTLFCGECNRRLKSVITQKPHRKVAMLCDNVKSHREGKIYLWNLKNVDLVGSAN